MAIGASIYKININLSNLNSHYYEDFKLTVAKHPSESESRMMFRLMAFLYCAHKNLAFTKGLSTTDEPELWLKDLTGDILHWIELGVPDEKRVKQALGKSRKVSVFTIHPNTAKEWSQKIRRVITTDKLSIYHLSVLENGPIDSFTKRTMNLSCMIEDDMMYLSDDNKRIGVLVEKDL